MDSEDNCTWTFIIYKLDLGTVYISNISIRKGGGLYYKVCICFFINNQLIHIWNVKKLMDKIFLIKSIFSDQLDSDIFGSDPVQAPITAYVYLLNAVFKL